MPRPRPPQWLKRLALPVWNEAHRRARRIGSTIDALRHGRIERCDCCGAFAAMLHRPGVIPDRLVELWGITPRLAEAFARKESLDCSACGAKLRARRLARMILDQYPTRDVATSIVTWARRPESASLQVAELNRIDGLHESLAMLPGLAYSDFQTGVKDGSYVNGVRSEDLASLTYADASFDLVLTSETLEHVPDLAAALEEILRVLKPGGRHLFTVPLLPGVPATFARSVRELDGTVRHLVTPICHPRGDEGYPVFTEFGADLPEILRKAGFEVDIAFGPPTDDDLAQVFICRKPEA